MSGPADSQMRVRAVKPESAPRREVPSPASGSGAILSTTALDQQNAMIPVSTSIPASQLKEKGCKTFEEGVQGPPLIVELSQFCWNFLKEGFGPQEGQGQSQVGSFEGIPSHRLNSAFYVRPRAPPEEVL